MSLGYVLMSSMMLGDEMLVQRGHRIAESLGMFACYLVILAIVFLWVARRALRRIGADAEAELRAFADDARSSGWEQAGAGARDGRPSG